MPDFSMFTDRARVVMQLANQEARRFNHEYIGTEHILLGLVKEGSGVTAQVLKNLNVDLRAIRAETEKFVRTGPATVTIGKLPLTPRVVKVCEFAVEESKAMGHKYQGTEHLLLGLLREQPDKAWTAAQQVLGNLGLKVGQIRAEIMAVLGTPAGISSPLPWDEQWTEFHVDGTVETYMAVTTARSTSQEILKPDEFVPVDNVAKLSHGLPKQGDPWIFGSVQPSLLEEFGAKIVADVLAHLLPEGLDGLSKMRNAMVQLKCILDANHDPATALRRIERLLESFEMADRPATVAKFGSMMRCLMDLDWSTYRCPCGASLCTRGQSDNDVEAWLAAHKPDTNGKMLVHVTTNGARAWGGQAPPDEVKDLK